MTHRLRVGRMRLLRRTMRICVSWLWVNGHPRRKQSDIHSFWDRNVRQWAVCSPTAVRYFSALGYFYGKQMLELLGDTPIGLLQCAWAGSSCEAWLSAEDLELVTHYRGQGPWTPTSSTSDNFTPSVVWNGMLKPIIPYTMKGVLWYQGESNMGRAEELTQLFPQMIEGWRREWGQGEFPFCFAQLAPWSGILARSATGTLGSTGFDSFSASYRDGSDDRFG